MQTDDEDIALVKRLEALLAPHDKARQIRVSSFVAQRIRDGVQIADESPKVTQSPLNDTRGTLS